MGTRIAFLMRKAPYGSAYTAEGLRTLMGMAVFEAEISAIFLDDGVYALIKDQQPEKLDMKPLGDAFPGLGDFGVDAFYVHRESLEERGLTVDDLVVEAQLVDGAQIAELLEQAGRVLPF